MCVCVCVILLHYECDGVYEGTKLMCVCVCVCVWRGGVCVCDSTVSVTKREKSGKRWRGVV